MPNSEIDDIFAAKGKQKAVDPPEPPKASESVRKSKKKKGKRKRDLDEIEHISAVPEEKEPKRTKTLVKQRVPETVVDPSLAISSTQKSHKPAIKPSKKEGKGDDKDRFKDSRGTGSSMSLLVINLFTPREAIACRAHNRGWFYHLQRGRTRHIRTGRRYATSTTPSSSYAQ